MPRPNLLIKRVWKIIKILIEKITNYNLFFKTVIKKTIAIN
jgi:hypothetical protein